jgi:hypothetical protein
MEQRLHFRLQSCLDHLLRNAVGHSRNAQLSLAPVFLWYLHRPNRWRKVAARRHPIPDLVKILLQPLFKIFDRLLIDPCCSFILVHPLVRFPNLLLRNTKRLCLIHRAPPIAGWLIEFRLLDTAPSLHPFIGDFPATTRCSAPESPLPYSRPRGSATCGFSVGIGVSGSHVPLNRLFGKLRPPLMPDATPPVIRFRRSLVPQ